MYKRQGLGRGLIWAAAIALTIVALYPALWSDPAAVLATVGGSANRHLDEALRETFFLGRAVFDPGSLFYPVALLWRLSPVVWLAALPALSLLRRSPAHWEGLGAVSYTHLDVYKRQPKASRLLA